MATPPVQATGSPFQTTWTGTGTKTAGGGLSVASGAIVVVLAVNEDAGATTIGAPSNTGSATVSWTARGTITASGHCYARADTGSVTGSGTLTVSQNSTSNNWGFTALVFDNGNHGGLGQTPAGASGGPTVAPTLTPASAWTANSLIACADGDWSAASPTGHTYRTNVGSATEIDATNVDGNYTTYAWYHADSGASPGTGAVGMTAPTQTYSLIAVEVLGTTGGATIDPGLPAPVLFSLGPPMLGWPRFGPPGITPQTTTIFPRLLPSTGVGN